MNYKTINKLENKIADIIGYFKGSAYADKNETTTIKTHVIDELQDDQLKKLMKLGKI